MSTDATSSDGAPRREFGQHPDDRGLSRRNLLLSGTTLAAASAWGSVAPVRSAQAQAQPGDKPNILVIFGDDIGLANISAYSHGLMGYRTPNIDRIARDGMMFIDYYAEQSCTAGRSTFITGQATLRTGLSKVGIPAAPVGLQDRDATIAQLLKPLGYATGQFGKNHLGDKNEYLPTVHGFDEFFGNLYHLNAEEEPENFNYPRDPRFRERFGPRGVLRTKATDTDDPTEDPRWGRVGRQTIEDTGPLTRKRMETIDDETSDAAVDYMQRQVAAGTPFFCWFNSHSDARAHARAGGASRPAGLTARTEYADGMIEHDGHVGKLLQTLDDLGIADNTIVLYTTDNGPHMNTWPDGAMTPFRSEKNTNWEGAFRVPCMIRWPGRIAPGQVSLEIVSGLDWCPTLLAAAGDPDIKEKLLTGYEAAGRTFKVHLDGYNQLPYLTGQEQERAQGILLLQRRRRSRLPALRELEDRVHGAARARHPAGLGRAVHAAARAQVLRSAGRPLRAGGRHLQHLLGLDVRPRLHRVRRPGRRARFLETFKEFPPSQRPATFTIDQAMEKLQQSIGN